MRIRRPVIYAAVSAAAIATAGLLASPATASTTQSPWQAQGQIFNLYNANGYARGTITASQYGQPGQYYGPGSVTVAGWVSNSARRGTIEEVFLSSDSWQRGELIGSAGPGQDDQFPAATLYNTNSGTITLCAANRWGGRVWDCVSQSFTVYPPQFNPGNQHNKHFHPGNP